MQTLFHKNHYRQRIANGHSCMVRVHTKPEYQMMTPDTHNNQPHDWRQVYVVKSRGYGCFYYLLLLAMHWHDTSLTRRVCVCLLRRMPMANFDQRKVAVTHPCTSECHFRMAEPGRTVMGVRYRWRWKPCWECFLGVPEGD
jgi:hypothetical protein